MSDLHNVAGVIAGFLSIPASLFYIRAILKGETRPNRASWFIWSVISIIILITYWYSGARETIWMPVSYAFCSTIIFLFSVK